MTSSKGEERRQVQQTSFQGGEEVGCSVPFSKGKTVGYLFPRGVIAREGAVIAREGAVQHTFCKRMLMLCHHSTSFPKR